MNVVYTLTSNYVRKALPSMRSLLAHNPKAKIYLLTETDTVDIDVPLKVINISEQKWFPETGVNYHTPFSYVNLLKVVYTELLPKLQKVIHMDADTVICDSLDPIWNTDLSGKWVAAVPEYRGRYHPFGPMYYNMGMAVLNLAQMRKDGIMPWMVEYLNTVPQPYADQDAFNKPGIEQDKFVPLDIRYNECFATGETGNPAIVHYCGWFDWYENPWIPRREYLERYL
jgi:lipopolysaccharide biosynthesis glycosyltransferase